MRLLSCILIHFYTRCNFCPWKFRLCRILNIEKVEEARTEIERERGEGKMGNWQRNVCAVRRGGASTLHSIRWNIHRSRLRQLRSAKRSRSRVYPWPRWKFICTNERAIPALWPSFDLVPASTGLKKEPRKVCTLSSSSVCLWKTGEFSRTKEYCGASCIWQQVWWESERLAEWEMMK